MNNGVPLSVEVPLTKVTLPLVVDVAERLNVLPVIDILPALIMPLELEFSVKPLFEVIAPDTVIGMLRFMVVADNCTAAGESNELFELVKVAVPDETVSKVLTVAAPIKLKVFVPDEELVQLGVLIVAAVLLVVILPVATDNVPPLVTVIDALVVMVLFADILMLPALIVPPVPPLMVTFWARYNRPLKLTGPLMVAVMAYPKETLGAVMVAPAAFVKEPDCGIVME